MMRFAPLALVLLLAAAPGDQLPLTQGIFVIAATPCKGAPNSDIMSYWGGNNALNTGGNGGDGGRVGVDGNGRGGDGGNGGNGAFAQPGGNGGNGGINGTPGTPGAPG